MANNDNSSSMDSDHYFAKILDIMKENGLKIYKDSDK